MPMSCNHLLQQLKKIVENDGMVYRVFTAPSLSTENVTQIITQKPQYAFNIDAKRSMSEL